MLGESIIAEKKNEGVLGQGHVVTTTPPTLNQNIQTNTGETKTPVLDIPKQTLPKIDNSKGEYFGNTVRLGSRMINLRIVPKFDMLPKEPAAQSIRDEVVKRVGSQWKKGTRDVIRGLTSEEEVEFLPVLIGIKPSSESWDEKTLEFWANFTVEVQNTPEGITFEAGLHRNKKQKIEPIDLEGYMKYNFCMANSQVADENEDNLINKVFQMVDKAKKQIEEEEFYKRKKDIEVEYIKLIRSTNPEERAKIDWILEIYGGDTNKGINIIGMTDVQKEMALEKFKDKQLDLFIEILGDIQLELKSLLRKAVSRGELSIEGNTYFLGSKAIGDLKATLGYFSDPNHATERIILVERLKA